MRRPLVESLPVRLAHLKVRPLNTVAVRQVAGSGAAAGCAALAAWCGMMGDAQLVGPAARGAAVGGRQV